MKKQRLIEVIKPNEVLNDDDLRSLQNYKDQYPFSQLVHTLLARHHHRKKTPLASSYIQKAAFYTTDRSVLKKFIEAKAVSEDIAPPVVQEEEKVAPQPSVASPSPTPDLHPEPDTAIDQNEEELDEMRSNIISGLDELAIKKQRMKEFLEDSSKSTPQKKSKKITTTKAKEPKISPTKTPSEKKTKKSETKSKKSVKIKKEEDKEEKKEKKDKKDKKDKKKKKSKNSDETDKKTKKSSDKKKTKTKKIIDRFIENTPQISQVPQPTNPKEEKQQEDLSETTAEFSEDFASENLAQILVNQGNKEKAIDIYKKLIWKYPQKKAYFASQIEMLKK